MNISTNGINLIKQFEGFKSTPYQCTAGVWTIGYGTTKYPTGQRVAPSNKPITETYATECLLNDVKGVVEAVNKLVKGVVAQNSFDALVSFIYNVGIGAFTKSTLLKKLNAGDKQGAAEEFLKWTMSGGKVTKGLVTRRTKEKELFLK